MSWAAARLSAEGRLNSARSRSLSSPLRSGANHESPEDGALSATAGELAPAASTGPGPARIAVHSRTRRWDRATGASFEIRIVSPPAGSGPGGTRTLGGRVENVSRVPRRRERCLATHSGAGTVALPASGRRRRRAEPSSLQLALPLTFECLHGFASQFALARARRAQWRWSSRSWRAAVAHGSYHPPPPVT